MFPRGKTMGKLTDMEVKKAVATDKRREIPDGDGLYLIVQPSGVKSWAVRYRMPGSNRIQKFTIGRLDTWSLKAAREKLREVCQMTRDKLGDRLITSQPDAD